MKSEIRKRKKKSKGLRQRIEKQFKVDAKANDVDADQQQSMNDLVCH
jgi:hypothetical protein